MPEPEPPRAPANVLAAKATKVANRDTALLRAAVEVLGREVRRQLSVSSTPPVGPDPGEPAILAEILARTPRSKKSWYRLCASGEWSVARLNRELTELASLVIDEHRIPPALQPAHGDSEHLTPERVLAALALHAARPVPDGPIADIARLESGGRTATLIGLAADVLMKAGLGITHRGRERLEQYHHWLKGLASASTPGSSGILRIAENERRVAGLLAGLGLVAAPPEPGERGDPSGVWAEGVVEALVQRDELGRCWQFLKAEAASGRWDRLDRGVLHPLEYFAERLVVRLLAGPASAPATRKAREEGRVVANALQRLEDSEDVPRPPLFLRRRAAASRHYLLGDWRQALQEAVVPGLHRVRVEVEREYGFSILAAIAHEAATNVGDLREPYTASFLHAETVQGRGPFLDAPIREMGEELAEVASIHELAEAASELVPQANAEALDAAVWELVIARAFNASPGDYGRTDLLALAADLRERAARIDGAATQLELLASEN